MKRTVTLHLGLRDLSQDDRAAWQEWLHRHGVVDPNVIPLGSRLVVDDDARTVTFERFLVDHTGQLVTFPDEDGEPTLATQKLTVQLEAPAAPIPNGYPVRFEEAGA
jgi:hypothetical protein